MTNYPNGLSSSDMRHIEGADYPDLTQADRDELRGQDWMRGIELPEHAAIPIASRDGRAFYALCKCQWQGSVHWASDKGLMGPLEAKKAALADADLHNTENRKEEVA